MYSILKSTVNGKAGYAQADTTAASPDPSPTDPWLFTDPVAFEIYRRRDQLEALEDDIYTYVMVDGQWAPEELEYKLEIRRLLREAVIAADSSFGHLSPHPTVYRTLKDGNLVVSGRRYAWSFGEDLIFEPWLARYSHPGLDGPLRIGQINHVSNPCLSCDAFPHVCIHCDKTRAIMRQILSDQNNGK